MVMTPEVICSEYRQAANREKQIRILSELNCCTQAQIADILAAGGETLPKKWANENNRSKGSHARAALTSAAFGDFKKGEASGITVGTLRELMASLSDEAPVFLDALIPTKRVTYLREFDAVSGETRESIMLSS